MTHRSAVGPLPIECAAEVGKARPIVLVHPLDELDNSLDALRWAEVVADPEVAEGTFLFLGPHDAARYRARPSAP